MKRKINKIEIKIIFILLLLLSILSVTKALNIISSIWTDNDPKSALDDTWKFDTTADSNTQILITDNYSDDYKDRKLRMKIKSTSIAWNGFLTSDQYGGFYATWWLELIKDDYVASDTICTWEEITYSFSWILNSPLFWDLSIWNNTYCPTSWKFEIALSSDIIWYIELSQTGTTTDPIIAGAIFDNRKIDIAWKINSSFTWTLSEYTKNNKYVLEKINIKWQLSDLKQVISKNVVKLTNGLTPENYTINPTITALSKNVIYYNLTWQIWTSNWDWNFWKIVTLWIGWNASNYAKIWVNWEKTIIIKWANLYINADIYNIDKNSLLTIVVQRDGKNWGNIYIDPDVTNIDTVLYAEWSMLSYETPNIISSENDGSGLRRQLLIYGSVSTRNTIWTDKAPYWSDIYIDNENNIDTKQYNLEYLRSFQVIPSDSITTIGCNGEGNIVAMWSSETTVTQYAFAWKKACYASDPAQANLRTTKEFSSLVIEYNPMIKSINPKILRVD